MKENLLHKGSNVLFIDIETAGFPKKDTPVGILEVGFHFVNNMGFSKEVETLSQLYSIDGVVPYDITLITGIKGEMLEGKPHISEHIDYIQDVIDRTDIVVAHNAPFDIRCLELSGVDFTGKEVFDTSTHSRRLFPDLERHTMDSMCEFLNVKNGGAHRAIHDVNAMIEIYSNITDMNIHGDKIEDLIKKHKKLTYTKENK